MHQLGIEMIAAYSPQARGRSERAFKTHQERLVKELALHRITDMSEANRYIQEVYLPTFNQEFCQPPAEDGSGFVPVIRRDVEDILCEHYDRRVGNDNCVSFEGTILQIPSDDFRFHYVKVKVRVHRYPDGHLAVFHGPRKLAEYESDGSLLGRQHQEAA